MTEVLTLPTTQPRASHLRLNGTPPLENGDYLTRSEFERRYHAMPHVKKAELIERKVYMPSPVRFDVHAEPHGYVIGWLFIYRAYTLGVSLGDNPTLRLDPDNDPQPDAVLRINETCGGGSLVASDGYLEGAPELVVEIAASTASYDLREKLNTYRRNGVPEYLVWSFFDEEIFWFRLQEEQYVRLLPDAGGIIASHVFPGLRLNVNALLNSDLAQVLGDLQHGLATPEHASFVEQLAAEASGLERKRPRLP